MQLHVDQVKVKEMAARLREALGTSEISHSRALELVCRTLGYPNWDTLSGLLKQTDRPMNARPRLTAPVVVYLEAFARDNWGSGPTWAKWTLTDENIEKLWSARNSCVHNGFESVETDGVVVDEWDHEQSLRLGYDTAIVMGDRFWFRTTPKHADYDCETRYIVFDELQALLERGHAASTRYFSWCDGLLFRDGNSAKELALRLVDSGVVELNEARIDEMPQNA